MQTRRDFLRSGGALIVSFSAASAQGPFDTHDSHIDPKKLDSWLAVGADGTITAHTGKCDFGQGIFTAQTQLVAEELCVPLSRVKLIQCDTAVTPDQGTTSGSQSTPANFNSQGLALAAATAREALLGLAAQKLGGSVDQLTAADGVIADAAGRRVTYAELVGGRHFNLPLDASAKRRSREQWTVLGKPVPSLDRVALMTGRFEFVQSVRVPRMLHGRVVRPPGMGATVASVDKGSVRDIPGVRVVVRKDFVGVVAETQYQAGLAARQLAVRWSPGPELPAQRSFFEHLQRQPSRDTLSVDSGDVERALGAAAGVLRAQYRYPYQMHGSVGTSCAVADVRAGRATVWSATQSVYPTRSIVAKLLGLPLQNVRVIYVRGSGCYGLNGADAVSFDAAVLSQAVGRPVRLQFSRQDEMMWENLGAACVVEHRAAVGADGQITVWDRADWVASLGNRPGYDRPGNVISGMLAGYEPEPLKPGPAKAPAGKLQNQSNAVPCYFAGCIDGNCGGGGMIRSERVLTHTVRSPFFTGPLRSPLRIQNAFANECFMDELCAQAKADPVAFRLQHLHDPRIIGVVQAAAKAAAWETRAAAPAVRKTGVVRGRGIACVDYEGGNGYAALVAEVTVNLETGVVRPVRFVAAVDCGPISNPDGLRNQTEGGILQGMSRALVEEVTWDNRRITSADWETYNSLHLDYEMPTIETVLVTPEGVPANGAGETAITVTPAAIGNAIFDATGVRLRELPFTPERVMAAIRENRA
ncbi:MAG: putative isoquinoline 1-oxidoreductase subunit beta IorB, molybdoprotein [Candidatus Solibacter sp.]|nr:putative isoquinoline 1-oxidoreductase subunit beta IorB, molybdoprotein [Candidatus Solibacter sp.]